MKPTPNPKVAIARILRSTSLPLFATLGAVIVASGSSRAAESLARPNILWVVSEDNTYNYVGAYGDPLARTPNVDRLAKGGVVFDHVYTQPVCAPSRSTIITGRYASSLGTQHMRSTRPLPSGVRFFPEFLRDEGYFCSNNDKTDYNTSTSWEKAWDENSATAHWRHRRAGQPFFAVFNFMQSHESRLIARQSLVTDPAKVRVPAYLPDTTAVRADLAQYYDCVSQADTAIGKVLAELEADGLADSTIVFYYSDNGGVVTGPKRYLNDQGTHVAMIAHFPERFAGYAPVALGTHGPELVNFVDLAPTTLSLAGVPLPSQFQGRAFAGPARTIAPDYSFVFADRMDERYNLVRAITDGRYRYIRNYYPERVWGQHIDFLWQLASIREWELHYVAGTLNATQRKFFEPQSAEALYDCTADPDNVHNLATEPAEQGRLKRMRATLREHLLQIRDTGFLPEPMMIEQAGAASPTAVSADEGRYPLGRILDFLDAAQLGDSSRVGSAVAEFARDPLPVLRYWATAAAARMKSASTLEPLLADSDAVVRVGAAVTLLLHSENAAAMRVVADAITQTARPELRLFALDALARSPREMPKSLAAVVGQLAASNDFMGFDYYLARLARFVLSDYGSRAFRERVRSAP